MSRAKTKLVLIITEFCPKYAATQFRILILQKKSFTFRIGHLIIAEKNDMSQKPLSPEKYIKTRARMLPIYKCYLSKGWKAAGIANVIVARKHVTGNLTIGIYLVDLLCLGVKETLVLFNVETDELDRILKSEGSQWDETTYNLVHNIIFASLEYALEFEIEPHKEFLLSKYILEEDDDKIPIIEIAVGDENGNPELIVQRDYNFAPVLKKLDKNAGKGNYTFTILEDMINEDEDNGDTDEIEDGDLDFEQAAEIDEDWLNDIFDEENRSKSDQFVALSELMLRHLDSKKPGTIKDYPDLKTTKQLQLFEKGFDQWIAEEENCEAEIDQVIQSLSSLASFEEHRDSITQLQHYISLLDKHKQNSHLSSLIFSAIHPRLLIENTAYLAENVSKRNTVIQIFIACYAALQQLHFSPLEHIEKAAHAEMAFPFNKTIHALHHKSFFLLKAIIALNDKDKENILVYHNLLRISNTEPTLRLLYVAQFISWLRDQLDWEDEKEK